MKEHGQGAPKPPILHEEGVEMSKKEVTSKATSKNVLGKEDVYVN